jgi:hypothetical protein
VSNKVMRFLTAARRLRPVGIWPGTSARVLVWLSCTVGTRRGHWYQTFDGLHRNHTVTAQSECLSQKLLLKAISPASPSNKRATWFLHAQTGFPVQ